LMPSSSGWVFSAGPLDRTQGKSHMMGALQRWHEPQIDVCDALHHDPGSCRWSPEPACQSPLARAWHRPRVASAGEGMAGPWADRRRSQRSRLDAGGSPGDPVAGAGRQARFLRHAVVPSGQAQGDEAPGFLLDGPPCPAGGRCAKEGSR
jgi:hypothetical protein